MAVPPAMLAAWLAGRSLARGLPVPVPDHGGWRVDTRGADEICRWVFADVTPGLIALAGTIDAPGRLLKLCGDDAALARLLPGGWRMHAAAHFMIATAPPPRPREVPGYAIEIERSGAVVRVRAMTAAGIVAAVGHAAESGEAFVYDRIATEPEHRRRGLATALMAALGSARRRREAAGLLVATEAGRALYATLGWRAISAYATASFAG